MEPKAQAEEIAGSPAASEPDPHFPQPGGASTRTAFVSTGAVAPGRRPVGNTCQGPAGTLEPGPCAPDPAFQGPPQDRCARWGKGTRAAATLTRQRLLLRRQQQQSQRPPAPSSAAA
ncbi:hypothetical protein P7K49_026183 [Saguinus oedipus]|uniref:Uncharacterized protein n=1 Tax=Saguinus oedipus TaxID=9490 RepID=A0ABQ9UCH7_SAGOE|nr:hypothetical protein P7K49_026183 [Saguinus oedipus]